MPADGASGGEGGEQIHRSQEVTDSTSGEEQQMQGGSDSTAGAQDGITFPTPGVIVNVKNNQESSKTQ